MSDWDLIGESTNLVQTKRGSLNTYQDIWFRPGVKRPEWIDHNFNKNFRGQIKKYYLGRGKEKWSMRKNWTKHWLWSGVMEEEEEKRRKMVKERERRLKKTPVLPRRWSQIGSNPSSHRWGPWLWLKTHGFQGVSECSTVISMEAINMVSEAY